METIFMNAKNGKTNKSQNFDLSLPQRLHFRGSKKYVLL